MKNYLFIFAVIFTTCTKNLEDDKLFRQLLSYSTEYTKASEEKIDNRPTYEVIFNK